MSKDLRVSIIASLFSCLYVRVDANRDLLPTKISAAYF